MNGRDVKASARYAINDAKFSRRVTLEVDLPPLLAKKRATDSDRCEANLNRRYPFRAQLKVDSEKMSFGAGSRRRITELSRDPKKGAAARRTIEAVDGGSHLLRISPRETGQDIGHRLPTGVETTSPAR